MHETFDQQKSLWDQLGKSKDETIARIVDAVSDSERTGVERMEHLELAIAEVALGVLGIRGAIDEICLLASCGAITGKLDKIQEEWTVRLLNQVLSPWVLHGRDAIENTLRAVHVSIESIGDQAPGAWLADIKKLSAILDEVCHKHPSSASANALMHFEGLRYRLSSESQANWFLALNQASNDLRDDDPLVPDIQNAISVETIGSFLSMRDLPQATALQLRSVALSSESSVACKEFNDAQLTVGIQETTRIAAEASVVLGAYRRLTAAKEKVAQLNHLLKKLETELREYNAEWRVLWACLSNRGGLAITTAMADYVNSSGGADDAHENVSKAIEILDEAKCLALEHKDFDKAATSAARIAPGYQLIGQQNDAAQALSEAADYANKTDDPSTIQYVRKMALVRSPVGSHEPGQSANYPTDESGIRTFADSFMEAIGLPKNRRNHVEDDIRKQTRVEEAKTNYCRHLQPIQNLTHTIDASTAYARPTVHVCKCELLGHQTKIETEDAETALSSMISNFCKSCNHREPRTSS